ncbi:MAG: SDR family oxidoreductase [Candidatus Electrothrix aestuarii]|uniref:dTDP-4-dehydrorhamnose reductase n=1 Tax=Candidatus Electrothrix aestuarii TaxID=3062594 RepID=A0AAU8LTF9_9BACT|nr:SDR family oxidoreductase [Candidatus Electrothrix aestuarii]
MKKVLITGAAGQVGRKLTEYLGETGCQIIPVAHVPRDGVISADLRNEATVFRLVKKYAPDIIIHLAAITNLHFCEQNKETAHATNYGITEVITRACSEFRIRMIFFSSDYVFGEYDHFWQEEDLPCPTTQYGIDKAASEWLVRERLSNYAIIRTAQLYGLAKDFVRLVCGALLSRQEFIAYANLVNCPTWIGDLFPMVNKIINYASQGIFHCVGPQAMSRYQYASEIAEVFALKKSYIKAVNLDFSADIRPPVVRLNGTSTYEALHVYPGTLKKNLAL